MLKPLHEMTPEELKAGILDVIASTAAESLARARKSDDYQRLFKRLENSGIAGLLREAQADILRVALNTGDIIERELGRDLTVQERQLLQALPFVIWTTYRDIPLAKLCQQLAVSFIEGRVRSLGRKAGLSFSPSSDT